MKLICDDNLGKLTSYLRILGFDTIFEETIDDNALLRIASAQKRFLITRDNKLLSKTHPFGIYLVEEDDPLIQLKSVISKLNLTIDSSKLFSRCSKCNELCEIVDKDKISDKIFPFILKTQDIIKQCPQCKRSYWKGSHYKNILKKLISVVPANALDGDWPEI